MAIILLLQIADNEKTGIREIETAALKQQIETFISENNLAGEDSLRVMDILRFTDFTGHDLHGNYINFSDPDEPEYKKSGVIIFGYHAEWCVNCRRDLPALIRLHNKYSGIGLSTVITYLYSNPERVGRYTKENAVPFPVLIGSDDREENPGVRLETTHYILRTLLEDYRRWGTPFYIIIVNDKPGFWHTVPGEFIEEELDEFINKYL